MAKKASILDGLVVTLIITLGCNIDEASARDVKLMKLRDVNPETLKTMKQEEEIQLKKGEIKNKLVKEIEKAKEMIGELKEKSNDDMKRELSSLLKSESLLDEISDSIKKGTYNGNKANIFAEKERFFYKTWKDNAYDSVVPDKEIQFMLTIKQIIKLLKTTV